MLKNKVVRIVVMFLALAVLVWVVNWVTGMDVLSQENFLYPPDDCKNICAVNTNKYYCNSPDLKDGSAARCNCSWNSSALTCEGSTV